VKKVISMIALALTGVLGSVSAQECSTGRLTGLNTRTQTVAGVSSGHYEEKTKKNGKKVLDGYTYTPEQTLEIYVLTVEMGELTYTTENLKNVFFGYNPADMVVNDPVAVCVEKNRLVLTRPDGKKYKTRIVRTERNAGAVRVAQP
jgi:hypothetical protein